MKMDRIVFQSIPWNVSNEDAMRINGIRKNSGFEEIFMQAVERAKEKLACKAILKWADVKKIEGNQVTIDDVVFTSKVLAHNLKDKERVFLYLLIVGDGIDEDEVIEEDVVKDMIRGTALYGGMRFLETYLKEHFGFEDISYMNPGSLPDWPIENNVELFRLLEGGSEIGATLNQHCYIIPWNASSGIAFENGQGYLNCTLCKKQCEKRRAPFQKEEYDRIFAS